MPTIVYTDPKRKRCRNPRPAECLNALGFEHGHEGLPRSDEIGLSALWNIFRSLSLMVERQVDLVLVRLERLRPTNHVLIERLAGLRRCDSGPRYDIAICIERPHRQKQFSSVQRGEVIGRGELLVPPRKRANEIDGSADALLSVDQRRDVSARDR